MHRDLEQAQSALHLALAGITPADAERSVNGAWSVANIVEHLDLTFTRNAAGVARRLEKPDAPIRRRSLKQALARFVIVGVGYFPTGRKSPAQVVPQGRPMSEVVAGLDVHLEELDRVLAEGERVFGANRAVLDHPIVGPFSVADWRRFHLVHTRHHVKQIRSRRV